MKRFAVFTAVLVAVTAPASWAQQGGMGGMDMKDKGHENMDMSKCKGMDMDKCMQMMDKDKKSGAKKSQAKTHKGTGVVKNVDAAGGKVTIAHGPIPSISWPAMSMAFSVKDKKMLAKLAPEKKVEFQFVQQGSDYVITSIK
jgi:Cu(I)/Ag(I) efflux system periplasmic protein CusF